MGLKIFSVFFTWEHTKGASSLEFFCWVSSSEMQGVRNFFTLMSGLSVPISHNQDTWKHLLGIPSCSLLILSILCLCWLPPQLTYGAVSPPLSLLHFYCYLMWKLRRGQSLSRSCAQLIFFEHHSQPHVHLPQTSEGEIPSLWSDNLWLPFTRPRVGTYAVVFPNIITKLILWDQFVLNCSWIILWNCFAFKAFILQSG